MAHKFFQKRSVILFVAIVALGLSRLIPHTPNFSVMGALAILAGAYSATLGLGVGAVLLSLLIGDIFLGFHETQWAVYLGFVLVAAIGSLVRKHRSLGTTVLATAFGSGVFFVVSNFGVWLSSGMYAQNWQGLVECFAMAIPFMEVSLTGDLFFVTTGYLVFELIHSLSAPEVDHAR